MNSLKKKIETPPKHIEENQIMQLKRKQKQK